MELIDLLQVVRRWFWLIVAVVVVTELALWLGTQSAEPVYAATVRLQISTPQREEVAAYDEYRSISLRDEITVAINNFTELLRIDEVYKRTISQLGLEGKDGRYTLSAAHGSDADFVNVTVEARTPSLAAEIANTHVDIAIAYYGELHAKSTSAEKELFAEQLRVAEEEFQTAEKTLVDFRTQSGIFSLESQLSTQQKLLEQLQLERDQRLLEETTTVITTTVIDPISEVDNLIAKRQKELEKFTALAPQYNVLAQKVEQAREAYQHLLSKYSEAELKVTAVQAANFIQVVKPAYAPAGPKSSSWPKLAVLALAGSLGLGVMLAFLLQYISGFKAAGVTVSESEEKVLSRAGAGEPKRANDEGPTTKEKAKLATEAKEPRRKAAQQPPVEVAVAPPPSAPPPVETQPKRRARAVAPKTPVAEEKPASIKTAPAERRAPPSTRRRVKRVEEGQPVQAKLPLEKETTVTQPKTTAKARPAAKAKPKAATKAQATPAAKPGKGTRPKAAAKAKPGSEAKPKTRVTAKPATETKPKTRVTAKPATETKPKTRVTARPATEPKPKTTGKAKSATATKPARKVKPPADAVVVRAADGTVSYISGMRP